MFVALTGARSTRPRKRVDGGLDGLGVGFDAQLAVFVDHGQPGGGDRGLDRHGAFVADVEADRPEHRVQLSGGGGGVVVGDGRQGLGRTAGVFERRLPRGHRIGEGGGEIVDVDSVPGSEAVTMYLPPAGSNATPASTGSWKLDGTALRSAAEAFSASRAMSAGTGSPIHMPRFHSGRAAKAGIGESGRIEGRRRGRRPSGPRHLRRR